MYLFNLPDGLPVHFSFLFYFSLTKSYTQQIALDFQRLEYLRPRIYARHQAYEEAQQEHEARKRAHSANRSSAPSGSSSQYMAYSSSRPSSHSSSRPSSKPLDLSHQLRPGTESPGPFSPPLEGGGFDSQSGSTQEVAIELARQEFARREKEKLSRRGTRSSKFSDREVERVSAPPTPVAETVKNRYSQLRDRKSVV